jgi:hypothetical protein
VNWLEIDAILYGIIARHDNVNDMLDEAQKQFKWTPSQADDAMQPLIKRAGFKGAVIDTVKPIKRTKRK